jgi:hypothetical protein
MQVGEHTRPSNSAKWHRGSASEIAVACKRICACTGALISYLFLMLLSYSTRLARPMRFGPEMLRCYTARRLQFAPSACRMSARPFITLKYTGQPEHAPSSTTANKSDKLSNGDIKKQAIGDRKSANMTEECNSDPKVMNPLLFT